MDPREHLLPPSYRAASCSATCCRVTQSPPATTTAASAPCRHVTQPDVQPAPPCPSAQTCTPGRLLTPRLRLRTAAVDMDTDQQIENYYQVRARLRAATRFR